MMEIEDRYIDWLKRQAMGQDRSYDILLDFLYNKPFTYTVRMDENRAEDGIELRYLFGSENGIDYEDIVSSLDFGRDCSMLEMMVGLARRCESQIMIDMEEGEQPERWFGVMLTNLGLIEQTNEHFDREEAEFVTDRFLARQYSYYGDGSLFSVCRPRYDMRKTDLWYQAMWYLTENYSDEEKRSDI